MQMLFQYDLSGNEPATILTTFEDFEKAKANTREFPARIFEGTVREIEKIDTMIVAQAENWRIERMAVVDLRVPSRERDAEAGDRRRGDRDRQEVWKRELLEVHQRHPRRNPETVQSPRLKRDKR